MLEVVETDLAAEVDDGTADNLEAVELGTTGRTHKMS